MIDPKQIVLTREFLATQAQPDAACREVFALIVPKAMHEVRRVLAEAAQMADFDGYRATHYLDAGCLRDAMDRHTNRLLKLQADADRLYGHMKELQRDIRRFGNDPVQQAELREAVIVGDDARLLMKGLLRSWELEVARRLQRGELERLKFGTAVEAIRLMLHEVKARQETPATPEETA